VLSGSSSHVLVRDHKVLPYNAQHISRVGRDCMYTLYDRIVGDFPAKNAVHTYIWFVNLDLANPVCIKPVI